MGIQNVSFMNYKTYTRNLWREDQPQQINFSYKSFKYSSIILTTTKT